MGENIEKSLQFPTASNPLPVGGTANQVLAKSSATDYACKWMTLSSSGIKGVNTYRTDFSVNSFDTNGGFTLALTRWLKDPNKPSPGTAEFYVVNLDLTLVFSSCRLFSIATVASTLTGNNIFIPQWYKSTGTLANGDKCIIQTPATSYWILRSDNIASNYQCYPLVFDTSTGKAVDLGTPTVLAISTTVNMFYS